MHGEQAPQGLVLQRGGLTETQQGPGAHVPVYMGAVDLLSKNSEGFSILQER